MPIETLIVVAGIVLAFTAFIAVLAWGEHATHHIHRHG